MIYKSLDQIILLKTLQKYFVKQWLEKSVPLAAFMFIKVWYFFNLFDPDFLMVIAIWS